MSIAKHVFTPVPAQSQTADCHSSLGINRAPHLCRSCSVEPTICLTLPCGKQECAAHISID